MVEPRWSRVTTHLHLCDDVKQGTGDPVGRQVRPACMQVRARIVAASYRAILSVQVPRNFDERVGSLA